MSNMHRFSYVQHYQMLCSEHENVLGERVVRVAFHWLVWYLMIKHDRLAKMKLQNTVTELINCIGAQIHHRYNQPHLQYSTRWNPLQTPLPFYYCFSPTLSWQRRTHLSAGLRQPSRVPRLRIWTPSLRSITWILSKKMRSLVLHETWTVPLIVAETVAVAATVSRDALSRTTESGSAPRRRLNGIVVNVTGAALLHSIGFATSVHHWKVVETTVAARTVTGTMLKR